MNQFAYSFDGEVFVGDFATREKAAAACAGAAVPEDEQWTAWVRVLTDGEYVVDNIMSATELAAQGAGK